MPNNGIINVRWKNSLYWKASVQTTHPDLWCFLPYPLPFVSILAAFSPSSVSILFFIFIHRRFLCFSLATETYLLASWSHLCSRIVKLPPAVALHVWWSLMRRVGSSSLPECQDFTPWIRQAGHCPLGMVFFLKKEGFSCVRKCNNTVIICCLAVHWNGGVLNF